MTVHIWTQNGAICDFVTVKDEEELQKLVQSYDTTEVILCDSLDKIDNILYDSEGL